MGMGWVVSGHGSVRRFWDVSHLQQVKGNVRPGTEMFTNSDRSKSWKLQWGDDSEAVVAFLPANDAFQHKKERMLQMRDDRRWDERGLLERYRFINDIHDALVFDCPKQWADEAVQWIKWHMEQPSLLVGMQGPVGVGEKREPLWCQVEVFMGETRAKAKKNQVA